jgi:NAD(P)-dependent dehydrogenase (short-subunit alcohol dehydrogenase family)
MRLKNRVTVVTGAGRGIGRAIAERFADEGAHVGIAEIQTDLAEETAEELGDTAFAVPTDVSDKDDVAAFFDEVERRFGRLDVLVCNAGRPYKKTSTTATEDEWDECLDLNLRSAWYCARDAYPLLSDSEGGSIVTIGSAQGLRGGRETFPYSVAKGGLLSLTRTLAVEYAPDDIRVNAVIPGQIRSVRTEPYFESFDDPEEARRRVLNSFPLGRLGKPEDIANAVLFLASEESEWVTGTWFMVDGGRHAAQLDLSDLK